MIKIIKKTEPIIIENIIVTIYGNPGSGKTSLALSASKAVLFDFDNGSHRALLKQDTIKISKWEEIENLAAEDLIEYDTIIVDTVGEMTDTLKTYLINKNPAIYKGGQLSPKGWGVLLNAFNDWVNKIKSYKKDIVFVAHAKKSMENEVTTYDLDSQGQSKNRIFKFSDLMGMMIKNSQGIILDFNSTDSYTNKDCVINFGTLKIPNVKIEKNYLANLIQDAKNRLNTLSEEQLARQKNVAEFEEQLATLTMAEEFTDYTTFDFVKNDMEFKILLHTKAKLLGFKYNEELKCYEPTTTLEK